MSAPEWLVSPGLTDYALAVAAMERHVAAIRDDGAAERVWLVEHPPLYTAGTSAVDGDLLEPARFPVHRVGRGGKFTYHGPGQRVAYVMLDLAQRGRDVRAFVQSLEGWLIATLAEFGVTGELRDGRVGVWVRHRGGEAKIAALGIRVRRWVSFHGVAVNVAPDLTHFGGIVPCGIAGHGVTSLVDLGVLVTMAAFDAALLQHYPTYFDGPSPVVGA